eukprot:COSAG01_NODE_975_length_12366_cov_20.561833_7_plen_120_part_00
MEPMDSWYCQFEFAIGQLRGRGSSRLGGCQPQNARAPENTANMPGRAAATEGGWASVLVAWTAVQVAQIAVVGREVEVGVTLRLGARCHLAAGGVARCDGGEVEVHFIGVRPPLDRSSP